MPAMGKSARRGPGHVIIFQSTSAAAFVKKA
jgi:hypothetical protein